MITKYINYPYTYRGISIFKCKFNFKIIFQTINKTFNLDLGLSRGYSGAKQAKHLLELASAGAGYGPGK